MVFSNKGQGGLGVRNLSKLNKACKWMWKLPRNWRTHGQGLLALNMGGRTKDGGPKRPRALWGGFMEGDPKRIRLGW